MLKELSVTDFAIVDKVSVIFERGFNVLTGETGAGKSILIGAVELALGGRPSEDMIRTGAERAVVEARFDLAGAAGAPEWLELSGLTGDNDEAIIRRIIARNGKNRVYINGAMATVAQTRELGSMLADIHGQHETQTLFTPARHLPLFDDFCKIEDKIKDYRMTFDAYRKAEKKLLAIEENSRAIEQRLDLLRHQAGEIENAKLVLGEDETLLAEKKVLSNIEQLIALGTETVAALDEEESSAVTKAGEAAGALKKMSELDESLLTLFESLSSALIQIDETVSEVRRYTSSLLADPGRLEEVNDRIDLIRSLKKKYGETIEDVLTFGEKARAELSNIEQDQEDAGQLEEGVEQLGAEAAVKALSLDETRHTLAARFEKSVQKELAELAMPKTRIALMFTYDNDPKSPCIKNGAKVALHDSGIGRMEIKISANPGEEPKPVSKIASGGEISRIMLAIKTILADRQPAPVMIFDEIDSGVGGVTADRVGEKLNALADRSQVFCVTHLAQVASQATAHYGVRKKSGKNATGVEAKKLDREARIDELARMAGGEQAPEAAAIWAQKALEGRGV